MRHQPPYERQVLAHLQNGPLGFAQLVAATGVPNTTSLSRTLKRLAGKGLSCEPYWWTELHRRTLYSLASSRHELKARRFGAAGLGQRMLVIW